MCGVPVNTERRQSGNCCWKDLEALNSEMLMTMRGGEERKEDNGASKGEVSKDRRSEEARKEEKKEKRNWRVGGRKIK